MQIGSQKDKYIGSGKFNMSFIDARQKTIYPKIIALIALGFGAITIITYAVVLGSLSVLIAYLVFGVIGLMLIIRGGVISVRIYFTIYNIAVFAAVILALIFISDFGVPYWEGGSDELMYESTGLEFAGHYGLLDYGDIAGGIVTKSHNSVGYIYIVGLMAKLCEIFGGFDTMVPRLFNAMCLALLSTMIYIIALRLELQLKTAISAALFSGLLPLMMWVSVQTLRDIIQALFLVTLLFVCLPYSSGKRRFSKPVMFLLSLLLVLGMMEIRKGQAFIAMIYVVYALFTTKGVMRPIQLIFWVTPISLFIVYIYIRFNTLFGDDVMNMMLSIDDYTDYRLNIAGEGVSSIIFKQQLFPVGWISRVVYALVSPLPVIYKRFDVAWLSFGTMLHILFIPFLGIGIKNAFSEKAWRHVLILFIFIFIGMTMFTFTIRHIIQYLPFAILLSSLGFDTYRGDPKKVWFVMVIIGLLLVVIYVIVK